MALAFGGGGLGENFIATLEVRGLCTQVQSDVAAQRAMYKPLWYRLKRVVDAGEIYYVKILVGPLAECVHVGIRQDLPINGGNVSLVGIQDNKTVEDPIEEFN